MSTAAVIIIGNEILTGKFDDANGPYFVRRLRTLGVDLVRLVVVRDELDELADEVRRCSGLADHVFTTGGVGPTHDDLTLEAMGRAFRMPLEPRAELVALLDRFDLPKDEATMRMATVPTGTELVWHADDAYPVLKLHNVWIFPGVPRLMRSKFEAIAAQFASDAVHAVRIYARNAESKVARALGEIAARHPDVEIGSYPRWGEPSHKLIVTLEGHDFDAVAAARVELETLLDVVRTE